MLSNITFFLVDMNYDVINSFSTSFKNNKNFICRRDNIINQKADCIVSSANSYGCMDGRC